MNKEKFHFFLEQHPDLPIYIQDWYLNLVCGPENWQVSIAEREGKTVAALPYYLKRNKFFNWIGMPPLSKLHGPHIIKKYSTNRHHHKIVDELIEQLPKIDFYQQAMDYGFTNWLPYLWKGYSQVTLYSYVFPQIDIDHIFRNIKSEIKSKIKINSSVLHFKVGLPFQSFYEVYSKTYKRQGLPTPFSYDFLEKYYKELKSRSCAELIFVVDANDVIHTGAMLIWDNKTAYYIMEGSDPEAPNNSGGAIMKWEAIKYTKNVLKLDRFDFEGSISKRIERTYRSFGATALPYYVIKKYNSKMFLGLKFIQNFRQYGKLAQW